MSDFPVKVARTKPFSPSKISLIKDCPLRYLLETENYSSVSPSSNIYAVTGTSIHKIVDINISNPSISGVELKKQFIEFIDKLIKRNSRKSLISWTYENYGLNGLISNERIVSSVQQIKRLLDSYGEEKSPSNNNFKFMTREISSDILGSEKSLEFKNLELAGKIDFSYMDVDGIIHVVDFKSGNVLDDEVRPKDGYLLQIAVYGLMLEQFVTNSKLLLELIGSNTSWSGPLDDELRGRVINLIKDAKTILPLNQELEASTLSKSGEYCSSCGPRFACAEYHQALNNRSFGEKSSICSSNDLIGLVSKVTKRENLIDILLKSNNQTICSIIGLPHSLYQEIKVGDLISAYFLGILDIEGKCKFPVNFFVFREDTPRLSSFEFILKIA